MRKFISNQLVAVCAFAAPAILMMTATAIAQQENASLEKIVVNAPVEIHRETLNASSSAATKVDLVELKQTVSIADLDLRKQADVEELESRIRLVAEDSCQRLAEMFPFDDSGIQGFRRCTKDAIESAMEQKATAIAEAN